MKRIGLCSITQFLVAALNIWIHCLHNRYLRLYWLYGHFLHLLHHMSHSKVNYFNNNPTLKCRKVLLAWKMLLFELFKVVRRGNDELILSKHFIYKRKPTHFGLQGCKMSRNSNISSRAPTINYAITLYTKRSCKIWKGNEDYIRERMFLTSKRGISIYRLLH